VRRPGELIPAPDHQVDREPDPPGLIVGTWLSEVRQTDGGLMTFSFHIGDDGRMEVTGSPVPPSTGKIYRRSGPYHLEGRQLVTPALNEGKPVEVWLQDGKLALEIDPSLTFRLRRN